MSCTFVFMFVLHWECVVVRSDIELVLITILESIFSMGNRDIANVFLNAATFSNGVEGAAEISMSFDDFRRWCSLLPSVRKFLGSLLIPPDAGFPSLPFLYTFFFYSDS